MFSFSSTFSFSYHSWYIKYVSYSYDIIALVDFIVVDLTFCKHIKLEFIWFVIEGTIPKLLLS